MSPSPHHRAHRTLALLFGALFAIGGVAILACRPTGRTPSTPPVAPNNSPVVKDHLDRFVIAKGEVCYLSSVALAFDAKTPGQYTIAKILPDWSHVQAGDLVVELDDIALEQKHQTQLALVQTQRLLLVQPFAYPLAQASDEVAARQARLAEEERKLGELEGYLSRCKIFAPVAGQVVYANLHDVVMPGVSVRDQQLIAHLRTSPEIQVHALVEEANIVLVKPGMPVTIRVADLPDHMIKGEVAKVNKYREVLGGGSLKKLYRTFINVLDPPAGLRSGMQVNVQILVGRQPEK